LSNNNSTSTASQALKRPKSQSPPIPEVTQASDFEDVDGSCSEEEFEEAKSKRVVNKKPRVSVSHVDVSGKDASSWGAQGWVKEVFSGPWYELPQGWPFACGQTYHRLGRNNRLLSEPHQRTNAIQFAIDKFERSNNTFVDFHYVLNKFNSWRPSIIHRHLRLGKCFNVPLFEHDSDWSSTTLERAANDAPLWTCGLTADMLAEMLPERRTIWIDVESTNSIDILTCASLWCSSHIHAATSMVLLIVTGTTSIAWMTKGQYENVLADLTYNSTTSLTDCPNDRHLMFLRSAAPGTALYIRPDALFELKLQPGSTVLILTPRESATTAAAGSATGDVAATRVRSATGVGSTTGVRSRVRSSATPRAPIQVVRRALSDSKGGEELTTTGKGRSTGKGATAGKGSVTERGLPQ
jgi:hypothetical protein